MSLEQEVRYPAMRQELLYAIRALSDDASQQSVWDDSGHSAASDDHQYSFDMALHAVLDDSTIADDPEGSIGVVLRGPEELGAAQRLIAALEGLLDDIGAAGTFSQAVASPAWPQVRARAMEARSVLGEPDEFP